MIRPLLLQPELRLRDALKSRLKTTTTIDRTCLFAFLLTALSCPLTIPAASVAPQPFLQLRRKVLPPCPVPSVTDMPDRRTKPDSSAASQVGTAHDLDYVGLWSPRENAVLVEGHGFSRAARGRH